MSSIWALSSRMEGTIMMRRLSGIDWHLEMAMGVAKDNVSSLLCHGLPTRGSSLPLATSRSWGAGFLLIIIIWSSSYSVCGSVTVGAGWSREAMTFDSRERNEREREKEKEVREGVGLRENEGERARGHCGHCLIRLQEGGRETQWNGWDREGERKGRGNDLETGRCGSQPLVNLNKKW